MSHFDIIEQLKNPKRFTEEEIRQHYSTSYKSKRKKISKKEPSDDIKKRDRLNKE